MHEVNDTLPVVHPKMWMWAGVSFLFLLSLFVWALFGRVSLSVPANGIILSEMELRDAGNTIRENVKNDEDKLRLLSYLWIQKQRLFQKHYITLVDLQETQNHYVSAKENIIQAQLALHELESQYEAKEGLSALVFVDYTAAKKIKPGMPVSILPAAFHAYQYGTIRGVVEMISHYPVSKESTYLYLRNKNLVDHFFQSDVPFIAKIRLLRNDKTVSGLLWTTKKGPPFPIDAGTFITANIMTQDCSPWHLLFSRNF